MGIGEVDAVARNEMGTVGSTGAALYQEDMSIVIPKMKAINERWSTMVAKVQKALSASTPAYPVAADTITNAMNALKADMRIVSKVLVGGEATRERSTLVGLESFDYNTGRYKLQPLPEKAELVFSQVNDLYFLVDPRRRADPAKGLASLEQADALFREWQSLAQSAEQGPPPQ